MNDEEIQPIQNIITSAFSGINVSELNNANKIMGTWRKVLLRINNSNNPNEGQNLADHSRVVDLKNGVLLIEADHPGWIELLQLHKKYILTGIGIEAPELKVDTLAFKLKGKGKDLYGGLLGKQSEEDIKKQVQKDQEAEENALKSHYVEQKKAENVKKGDLPPELASIFADLKQSMLTNSQK